MNRHHVTATELAHVSAPVSQFFHGGYGRLFPDLDPWTPGVPDGEVDEHLGRFVNRNMVEALDGTKIVRPAALAAFDCPSVTRIGTPSP